MRVIVTGAAGFIGMHVARKLALGGSAVAGIDSITNYYDRQLKHDRLAQLADLRGFEFFHQDLSDASLLHRTFQALGPDAVVHLAAQPGVRRSVTHPDQYFAANLVGFGNVLEACAKTGVAHLLYASSSSVYGNSTSVPFSVRDAADRPVSLYAATKRANELMAHAYACVHGLPSTGLRYFTVFGPWGRPDMAPWLFTEAILNRHPIQVFNHGTLQRDFTYISDAVEATTRLIPVPPTSELAGFTEPGVKSSEGGCPARVVNVGTGSPVELLHFIEVLEDVLDLRAVKEYLPMQTGDVSRTFADVTELRRIANYVPSTSLHKGLSDWVQWFQRYARTRRV